MLENSTTSISFCLYLMQVCVTIGCRNILLSGRYILYVWVQFGGVRLDILLAHRAGIGGQVGGVVNGRGYYVSLRGLTILVFFETVVFGLFLGGMLTAQVSTLP